ncbi:macro domain-containing protein [Brevibacillus sp. NRS-1366]|uniref:macro domain-containing protein n=1 Tax=Brevibacillus sp. NRS-1366 TaxID=3233899 RepID=UPI003D1CCAAD
MRKRIKVFFSTHAWKYSFVIKRFLIHWIATFSVVWTFTEFAGFFFERDGAPWKPPVWVVLTFGIVLAIWMSRPRLTRTVKLPDKDITLRITVHDIFKVGDGAVIIPSNCLFKHDHLDEGAILAQLQSRFYNNSKAFDLALENALKHEPHETVPLQGDQVMSYPVGTVARLELQSAKVKGAYVVATAELNEHGRAIPNREQFRYALQALWEYIGKRGRKEHLIIPVMGSGRNRLNVNRFELIHDIVNTFMRAVEDCKFSERLTIVIHPDAFMRNRYDLDEMEEYLRYVSKFEV